RAKLGSIPEYRRPQLVLQRGRLRVRLVAAVPSVEHREYVRAGLLLGMRADESHHVAGNFQIDRRKRIELHSGEIGGVVPRTRMEQLRNAISAVRRFELRGQTVWIGRCIGLIVRRDEDSVPSRTLSWKPRERNRLERRAQVPCGMDVTSPCRIVGDQTGDVVGNLAAAIRKNEILRRAAIVCDDSQCSVYVACAIERE